MTSNGNIPKRFRVSTWNGGLALDQRRAPSNTPGILEVGYNRGPFVEPVQSEADPNHPPWSTIINECRMTEWKSDIVLRVGPQRGYINNDSAAE